MSSTPGHSSGNTAAPSGHRGAPLPPDETARLAALHRYAILDTPPEAAFDHITRLISGIFRMPIAKVSLVDEGRQWFKSCVGLDVSGTGREVAFCAHAILKNEVLTRIHHRFFTTSTAVAVIFLACLLSGCSRTERPELRIAINPWPGFEFLYLAKEKGFFAAEGLNVRLVEYSSLGDCRVAFESSQVDAMATTLIEVVQARENSKRLPQVALVTDYSNGGDVILGRADVTSMADLKGGRVGLELGSLGVFMLARSLELAGMKLSDVTMVACAPEDMQAEIAACTLDALVTYPPTSVGIEAGGKARRLFSSAEIPGEIVDVVAVDTLWIQRDPTLPARMARVMQRALDYAHTHPQEAYAIMGEREGLSGAEFEKALKGIQLVNAEGQRAFLGLAGSLQNSLRDMERVLQETGQIRGSQPTTDPLPPAKATTGETEKP